MTGGLGELFPHGGGIPSRERWPALAADLEEACGVPLGAVSYTWREGAPSMALLLGPGDSLRRSGGGDIRLTQDPASGYPCAVYLPRGCDLRDSEKKWPLVFFFHGIGERGEDPALLLRLGLPQYLAEGGALEAIVVAPQCPPGSHWVENPAEGERLRAFLPRAMDRLPVDRDRVYLTGLSMGGRCCWQTALAMPDTFAAMAVICGRTTDYRLTCLRDMPIWMFHGVEDATTSFDNIHRLVPALLESGHRYCKLTVYPRDGHAIWDQVYAQAVLYDWLLEQRLSKNRACAARRGGARQAGQP